MTISPDIGLVLSGGGAYAAYEVGILKALCTGQCLSTRYQPINPGVVGGTSSGSLNAALLTSRPDEDVAAAISWLEDVWLNVLAGDEEGRDNGVFRIRLDPIEYFDSLYRVTDPVRSMFNTVTDGYSLGRTALRNGSNFALSTASVQSRLIQVADPSALIDASRLPSTLRAILDLDGIRRSNRAIRIAATNWQTGMLQIFSNLELGAPLGHEIIRASTAIPGIFPPVAINGVAYVDGALVTNTPLKPAIAAGANELHTVYLDPDIRNIALVRMTNLLQTFERALAISFATVSNDDIAYAASVNQGLAALRDAAKSQHLSAASLRSLVATFAQINARLSVSRQYRPLTIHRYHPREDLGTAFGLLDFSRKRIEALIEAGFHDALRHNCSTSGCVIP